MKLYVLFGQRKESYDGEHAPELLLAWDEYSVEENGEGWERELEEMKKVHGASMTAMRVINIEVDQGRIRALLIKTPTVAGAIEANL